MKLDDIDIKILKLLQQDGKITNVDLSQAVGLSPASTLERVRKLEQRQLIKAYHAELDPQVLGLHFKAVLLVKLQQGKETHHQFREAIVKIDAITSCLQVSGTFDYVAVVLTSDAAAFQQLITEQLAAIESIRDMQVLSVIGEIKDSGLPLK